MTLAAQWVFVAGAAMILWVDAVFPLLLLARGRLRRRPVRDDGPPRPVSVVLAAHDEADIIGARIQNLLAQDYPPDLMQIVVACDGDDDGTCAQALLHAGQTVEVLALPRRGKAAAMNAALAHARHDIIAFTDANSMWQPQALRFLVAPFADPSVGATAGDQLYVGRDHADPVAGGEATYWSMDRALKRAQSSSGSITSATGAIHALRREHVQEIPGDVTDDFFLSTAAIVAGQRLVFVPEARAYETLAPTRGAEFARKVRIMTRGLRAVRARAVLLDPRRYGFHALQLFTHKVMRRLLFVPLVLLAASALLGARSVSWLRVAAGVQLLFYSVAALGFAWPTDARGRVARVLRLPTYFCLVYAAAAVATMQFLLGRRVDRWRHERLAGDEPRASADADGGMVRE